MNTDSNEPSQVSAKHYLTKLRNYLTVLSCIRFYTRIPPNDRDRPDPNNKQPTKQTTNFSGLTKKTTNEATKRDVDSLVMRNKWQIIQK